MSYKSNKETKKHQNRDYNFIYIDISFDISYVYSSAHSLKWHSLLKILSGISLILNT